MTDETGEPKIIVDDDWKDQVQKEKEAFEEQGTESQTPQMPEPSFALLVTTLSTQALSCLGMIPDPMSGKPASADLPLAKHFIDTLGVLEQKTSGNLDDEEKQLLNESLHQLRMAFVMAGKSLAEESKATDPPKPTIELP